MLGEYLKFNNTVFPKPIAPTMNSKTLENVSTSEAGTDLVCIVRASKKSWSFKFNLTSYKKNIIKALCEEETVTMSYMGSNYTVRIRDYSERFIDGSEYLTTSDGLFEVSVKVMEY